MVVLAGSGHVIYGLGINRRAFDRNRLPFGTVVAVEAGPAEKEPSSPGAWPIMSSGSPRRRPPSRQIGLTPQEVRGPGRTSLSTPGRSTASPWDRISKKATSSCRSTAGRSTDINELRMYLAAFAWDDSAVSGFSAAPRSRSRPQDPGRPRPRPRRRTRMPPREREEPIRGATAGAAVLLALRPGLPVRAAAPPAAGAAQDAGRGVGLHAIQPERGHRPFPERPRPRLGPVVVRAVGRTLAVDDFHARDIFLGDHHRRGGGLAGGARPRQADGPRHRLAARKRAVRQGSGPPRSAGTWPPASCGRCSASLNVLVIPQANPYGNWFDRRENEQGLDLNRDHVKLESPETRAIHRVFRALAARGDAGPPREGRRLLPRLHRLRLERQHRRAAPGASRGR